MVNRKRAETYVKKNEKVAPTGKISPENNELNRKKAEKEVVATKGKISPQNLQR